MSKHKLALTSLRIRNFKSIRDTGTMKLGALTVIVGNNGSGKSSLVEGLEALRELGTGGLPRVMGYRRGLASWRHQPASVDARSRDVVWIVRGHDDFGGQTSALPIHLQSSVGTLRDSPNVVQIIGESLDRIGDNWRRDTFGPWSRDGIPAPLQYDPSHSLGSMLGPYWRTWQFLLMNPQAMGEPWPSSMAGENLLLRPDAGNVAEYLYELKQRSISAYQGVVDAMKFVLPYADDLQVRMRSEADRTVLLELKEGRRTIPSWMLSSGTLRTVALLACLRHPRPPRLLVIEELENGLDPRTIGLIVEEIRNATNSGRTQVIATTHSPYLMDLVPLECLILAERADGETRFRRPADDADVQRWSESFAPGELYRRDRLTGRHS